MRMEIRHRRWLWFFDQQNGAQGPELYATVGARRYNRAVATTPFSLDTSPEIEQRQIDAWRRMSPADKAATITALTRTAYALTWAGVRQRHPGATPRELFLRTAIVVLGRELASAAYQDAGTLVSR